MGLLDTLRRLLGSSPSETSIEDPAERATPASDPVRMYGTAPSDDGEEPTLDTAGGTEQLEPPERFARAAEGCADFWGEYDLDFSVDSLARVDDLLDERFETHRFVGLEPDGDGGTEERTFERVVHSFGSYCGETLVRDADWEWADRGDWVVTDGETDVDPFAVAADVFRGETTFTSVLD